MKAHSREEYSDSADRSSFCKYMENRDFIRCMIFGAVAHLDICPSDSGVAHRPTEGNCRHEVLRNKPRLIGHTDTKAIHIVSLPTSRVLRKALIPLINEVACGLGALAWLKAHLSARCPFTVVFATAFRNLDVN